MVPSITTVLALGVGLVSVAQAQYDPALVGTWSSKSKSVQTGPGFYNPVTDRLIEPALTGISYSFTNDGFYEEAYYRAIPNPTTPQCPQGIMQWQHGTYSMPGNGSLVLQPFAVDGRQLMSSPCSYSNSIYTRYSQSELIKSYQAELDPFHNVQRLNLYRFDGSPLNPMFLVASPPVMLPTSTLNPTATATSTAKATGKSRVKRDMEGSAQQPMGQNVGKILPPNIDLFSAERWWWIGVGLTAMGTVLYMIPASK